MQTVFRSSEARFRMLWVYWRYADLMTIVSPKGIRSWDGPCSRIAFICMSKRELLRRYFAALDEIEELKGRKIK